MKECKYCDTVMRKFHYSELTDYFHWYCDKCKAHCTRPVGFSETWRTADEWDLYIEGKINE